MRKKIGIFAGAVFCIILTAVICGVFFLKDKFVLKQQISGWVNDNYVYSLEYEMDNLSTKLLQGDFAGEIVGTKGSEVLYGELSSQNMAVADFYADFNGKIMINISPVFKRIQTQLSSVPMIGQFIGLIEVNDFFVSLEQLEEITGEKITFLPNEDSSKQLLESMDSTLGVIKAAFAVKQVKDIPNEWQLLGEEAYYFEINLENSQRRVIIGVPKDSSKNELALLLFSGESVCKLKGSYDKAQNVVAQMPDESLNEEQIETLKNLYFYWNEIKEAVSEKKE